VAFKIRISLRKMRINSRNRHWNRGVNPLNTMYKSLKFKNYANYKGKRNGYGTAR
jgi:hypothetical protein